MAFCVRFQSPGIANQYEIRSLFWITGFFITNTEATGIRNRNSISKLAETLLREMPLPDST